MSDKVKSVVIIGAGPAGLTAAYLLSQQGVRVTVLEADPRYVGGLSKTVHYKSFLFDIGGHRFFSKSERVERFWSDMLPDDMEVRRRQSRIYYRKNLFSYPLNAFEALGKLGMLESVRCLLSYFKARLIPFKDPKNVEEWVSNQFGWRLYSIFFRTYTEKVWGMSCKDISSDWAAQRIKGLSLGGAVWNALGFGRTSRTIKTLVDRFRYPRKGPGMMWEACAQKVKDLGGSIRMGTRLKECFYDAASRSWTIETECDAPGSASPLKADHLISSIAPQELLPRIHPQVSAPALQAAAGLLYRDFLIVALIVKSQPSLPDQWIYIHDPQVKVARVQNFRAWSKEMVPDPSVDTFGLEYFCFEDDGLWNSSDADLIRLAVKELVYLGLAKEPDIVDGSVVRQKKAYPVYDEAYAQNVAAIRQALESAFPTLHLVGRNGMHRYNNQDHAMMTAMLSVENIMAGERLHDVWRVNQDAEYLEGPADRLVPKKRA